MRSKNNTSIQSLTAKRFYCDVSLSLQHKYVWVFSSVSVFVTDKLTGVLPILSPGVPVSKVAAHVTGVVSPTKSPITEGEEKFIMRGVFKVRPRDMILAQDFSLKMFKYIMIKQTCVIKHSF